MDAPTRRLAGQRALPNASTDHGGGPARKNKNAWARHLGARRYEAMVLDGQRRPPQAVWSAAGLTPGSRLYPAGSKKPIHMRSNPRPLRFGNGQGGSAGSTPANRGPGRAHCSRRGARGQGRASARVNRFGHLREDQFRANDGPDRATAPPGSRRAGRRRGRVKPVRKGRGQGKRARRSRAECNAGRPSSVSQPHRCPGRPWRSTGQRRGHCGRTAFVRSRVRHPPGSGAAGPGSPSVHSG